MARKRLTDTKNESFLSSEWRLITQTPGRVLTMNLECAVKITVRLILGRALSFKLSAPFYRNQAYLAGFLRQPWCRHRKGCYSLCYAIMTLWLCLFQGRPSLVNPSSSASPSATWNVNWPWIIPTRSFEGAKTYVCAKWVLRCEYTYSMLPPFPRAFQEIVCNIPPLSEEFGDDVNSCPHVPSAKSVSICYILLLDKLLVWDAWDCTFQ